MLTLTLLTLRPYCLNFPERTLPCIQSKKYKNHLRLTCRLRCGSVTSFHYIYVWHCAECWCKLLLQRLFMLTNHTFSFVYNDGRFLLQWTCSVEDFTVHRYACCMQRGLTLVTENVISLILQSCRHTIHGSGTLVQLLGCILTDWFVRCPSAVYNGYQLTRHTVISSHGHVVTRLSRHRSTRHTRVSSHSQLVTSC